MWLEASNGSQQTYLSPHPLDLASFGPEVRANHKPLHASLPDVALQRRGWARSTAPPSATYSVLLDLRISVFCTSVLLDLKILVFCTSVLLGLKISCLLHCTAQAHQAQHQPSKRALCAILYSGPMLRPRVYAYSMCMCKVLARGYVYIV